MSEYHPDVWEIVKITPTNEPPIYKVLAGWYGGFAGANSWKLSSGIESVIKHDGYYELPQSSGSTYMVGDGNRKLSGLTMSMLASWKQRFDESKTATIELFEGDLTTLQLEVQR